MAKGKNTLNNPERFSKPHTISREKLERAAKIATDKLKAFAMKNGHEGFPGTCTIDKKYVLGINRNWEAGMYTGCYWLAYELTGDEFFRNIAEAQLPSYKTRIDEKIGMNDHDVGFVFTPSCIAAYKLTGNETAKAYALEAFDYYFNTSYSKEGKFIIRCWEAWDYQGGVGCRTMMDSLMNAPFMFWASQMTGNKEYYQAAVDHNRTTYDNLVREDGSTFHHFQFDPATAKPVRGLTFQGHADDSCWSRGHSWGVYGFPIAYSYCKEPFLVDAHKDVTYFMLNHLPEDLVPYWDYDFVDGDEPRDASAGAIAVCGMHEMLRHLPADAEQRPIFESAGPQILEAIIDKYTGDIGEEYDGLIHHVTHAVPFKQGIDEMAVYADYFYLEALLRYLKPDWNKYW